MPQIQVNEIDQSVVTRVVSDDKVKILVPIIASFGPSGDVNTFTDITDFNRMHGYTEVEFNPFADDYSRNYAAQLIQKGAAVSVVRVNEGAKAGFELAKDSTADRNTPNANTVCPASREEDYTDVVTKTFTSVGETTTLENVPIVPETITLSYKSGDTTVILKDVLGDVEGSGNIVNVSGTTVGTVVYGTGIITWTTAPSAISVSNPLTVQYNYVNYAKGTFCPQIMSITAKYSGSFGNDLMIGITPVTTVNVSQSYQYANVSVYRAIKNIVKKSDGTYNEVISGITVLETQRVTTNPDSPYYFEDVDFEFIKIQGQPNAREELRLVWSNISALPETEDVTIYSGFPTIRVRYNTTDGMVYNTLADFSNGTDFIGYTSDMIQKLRNGFKGYYTNNNTWTWYDVYQYQNETYGVDGVVPSLYSKIAATYENFTDPYMYDFDFITSGGFVYKEYSNTTSYTSTDTVTGKIIGVATPANSFQIVDGSNVAATTLTPGSISITKSSSTYTDADGDGKIKLDDTVIGTVDYETGIVTAASGQTVLEANDAISFKVVTGVTPVTLTVPLATSSEENAYTAYYEKVTPIHVAMRNLVETRQDCIALFDVPYDYDTKLIVEYSGMLNTSYGTMHHPWCWVQHPTIAGKQIRMAPSYIFLYTFLSNLIDNVDAQKWFPPAGVKRATARVVIRPDYEIGSVILNEWQNDNISRVNPIMRLKQYGYVIYGQYTTLQAIDIYTHSALESLNVRLISNVVKKKIFDTCLNLAFDPNTPSLWLKFFAQMDEFLRYMKYNEGVYDYKIKMDESTVTTDDINHLRCPGKVWIAPTRTAEFFDIDFIITEAGAIFPED